MSCILSFQNPGIDQQHAVIEYNNQEDCFVLQDLNTSQGTYVNDVRVQNAAVRLAPGDNVRFGFSGMSYTLDVENPPPVSQNINAFDAAVSRFSFSLFNLKQDQVEIRI